MTKAAEIEAVAEQLGISMTAEFVPWSKSRNAGDKPSLNWKVTIRKDGRDVLTTDYMAGSGHCPSYKQGFRSVDDDAVLRWECENGRAGRMSDAMGDVVPRQNAMPILPALADVLHSLASDADAIDCGSFEEWAENYGMDTDSRKAEATYRACLEIGLKLRNALGEDGLKTLREAVQDY